VVPFFCVPACGEEIDLHDQHLFSIETFEQSKIAHLQTEDWSLVASDITQ